MAAHIKDSEKKAGKPVAVAARIAWATVNKVTGGGAMRPRRRHTRAT
jgi:hypothetical protein